MGGDIVLGYDGTECADRALQVALDLASGLGSDLVIAYGYDPTPMGGEVRDQDIALEERGKEVTAEARSKAEEAGVSARTEVIKKKPAVALNDLALETGARMIVVGGYGERPIAAAILGATPHKLLQISSTPVLVVRADG